MLQYMITRCTLLLRSYPTSLDEDVTLMKEEQVIICNSQICNDLRICSANYIMLLLNPISGPDLEKQYSAEVI